MDAEGQVRWTVDIILSLKEPLCKVTSSESSYADTTADVDVLVAKDNGKKTLNVKNGDCLVIHGVEHENDGKTQKS